MEFSEFFEQIRHRSNNQSESRSSQPVPGLLVNSAGNEVGPIKMQVLKVGAKVATGCEVLRRRSPNGSRDETDNLVSYCLTRQVI